MILRDIQEKGTSGLNDIEAYHLKMVLPVWQEGVHYQPGQKIAVNEDHEVVMYRCITEHLSQKDSKPSPKMKFYWLKIEEKYIKEISRLEQFNQSYLAK